MICRIRAIPERRDELRTVWRWRRRRVWRIILCIVGIAVRRHIG